MTSRLVVALGAALLSAAGARAQSPAQLDSLLRAERFGEVVAAGYGLIRADSLDLASHLMVGRALIGWARPAEALPVLDRLLELDRPRTWAGAWADYERARALFALDSVDAARAALLRARGDGTTPNLLRAADALERLTGLGSTYDGWRSRRVGQVRIHFAPSLDTTVALDAARRMDAARSTFEPVLLTHLLKPVDVFLWRDAAQARAAGMDRVGFARPELGVVHARTNQSPGHEIAHVYVFALHPTARTRFVNEGVATLFDASGRDRLSEARAAVARHGGTVRIRELWEHGDDAPEDLLYPVSAALLSRLLDHGGGRLFRALLIEQTMASAERIYGPRLDELIRALEDEIEAAR